MSRRGVTALAGGGYRVRLEREERELLRSLAEQLEEVVASDDPAAARLSPPAYEDDNANAEYRRLVGDGLIAGRVATARTLARTSGADRLTDNEANAWCGAVNDLRLVLGERLGVTEDLYDDGIDPSDPRAPDLALYAWLTWLQGELVEALSSRLPG